MSCNLTYSQSPGIKRTQASLGGCYSASHMGIKHSKNYISDTFLLFSSFSFLPEFKIQFIEVWIDEMTLLFLSLSEIKPSKKIPVIFYFPPSWIFSGQHLRNSYTGFAEIWATMLLLSPGTPKHSMLTTDAWFKRVFMNHAAWGREDCFLDNCFLLRLRKAKKATCLIIRNIFLFFLSLNTCQLTVLHIHFPESKEYPETCTQGRKLPAIILSVSNIQRGSYEKRMIKMWVNSNLLWFHSKLVCK